MICTVMLNSTNVSRLMKSFSMCSIQKARRILTFGQRSIAEKITSVDIYMSNSSAYITTNSIVIWKQLRSEYEKFSMSTKDVNVQQKSKAYFIKKSTTHCTTRDRRQKKRQKKNSSLPRRSLSRPSWISLTDATIVWKEYFSYCYSYIRWWASKFKLFSTFTIIESFTNRDWTNRTTAALVKKLKSIEVDLKSYFDDDAKVGLEHLLKSLLSTVVCRKCNDPVDEDMVQVKCSSCFHTYHARLCAGLSYVPKKKAWLCPECL